MPHYDVNAAWDDPFEHLEDRRTGQRFKLHFEVTVVANAPGFHGPLVGPGIVRNLSIGGILLVTKHQLDMGQWVSLTIPTDICSDADCFPSAFSGSAEVERIQPVKNRCTLVALRFGEAFTENMDFMMFVERLQARVQAKARPGAA